MGIKHCFRHLNPLKLYSVDFLMSRVIRERYTSRRCDWLRSYFNNLTIKNQFPTLGDGIVEGNISWFGYRWMSLLRLPRSAPPLPVFSRPIIPLDLIYFIGRGAKLIALPQLLIEPQDIHPFTISVILWKPFKVTARKRRILRKPVRIGRRRLRPHQGPLGKIWERMKA